MTVTTPAHELMAHARRCESEGRWAQAAADYQQILDNMPNPTSADHADDRAAIRGMHSMCVARSREMVSTVATSATEEAKAAVDHQGAMMAQKRARAILGTDHVRELP